MFKKNMGQKDLNYLVVSLDNRYHGDRKEESFREKIMTADGKLNLYLLRKIKKDTVEDITTLIDYFITNYTIDKDRIGMIGISMGGYITYASLIKESRIKVAIPFISSPFWDDIPKDTPIDEKDFDKFIQLTNEFNPAKEYQKFFPRCIFMSIGRKDKHFDLEKFMSLYSDLEKCYVSAPNKIKLKVYDVAHEVTDEMWNDALEWLKKMI
jgi:predicted esterase